MALKSSIMWINQNLTISTVRLDGQLDRRNNEGIQPGDEAVRD